MIGWLICHSRESEGKLLADKIMMSLSTIIIETLLMPLQTEQTQIRQLSKELPDQGLLCLLIEI